MTEEVAKAMKVVMGDIAGRDGRKGGDSGHENGCGWGGISRAIDDVWQPRSLSGRPMWLVNLQLLLAT